MDNLVIVTLTRHPRAGALAAECAENLAAVLSDRIERYSCAVIAHTTLDSYQLRLADDIAPPSDAMMDELRLVAMAWLQGWRSALGALRTRSEVDARSCPHLDITHPQ